MNTVKLHFRLAPSQVGKNETARASRGGSVDSVRSKRLGTNLARRGEGPLDALAVWPEGFSISQYLFEKNHQFTDIKVQLANGFSSHYNEELDINAGWICTKRVSCFIVLYANVKSIDIAFSLSAFHLHTAAYQIAISYFFIMSHLPNLPQFTSHKL